MGISDITPNNLNPLSTDGHTRHESGGADALRTATRQHRSNAIHTHLDNEHELIHDLNAFSEHNRDNPAAQRFARSAHPVRPAEISRGDDREKLVVFKPVGEDHSEQQAQFEAAMGHYFWCLAGSNHAPRSFLATEQHEDGSKAVKGNCSMLLEEFKDFSELIPNLEGETAEHRKKILEEMALKIAFVLRLSYLVDENDATAQNFGMHLIDNEPHLAKIDAGQMLFHMQQADPYNQVSWHLKVSDRGDSRISDRDIDQYPVLTEATRPRIWPGNPEPFLARSAKQFGDEFRVVLESLKDNEQFKQQTLLADIVFLLSPMDKICQDLERMFVCPPDSDICRLTITAVKHNYNQVRNRLLNNQKIQSQLQALCTESAFREKVIETLTANFHADDPVLARARIKAELALKTLVTLSLEKQKDQEMGINYQLSDETRRNVGYVERPLYIEQERGDAEILTGDIEAFQKDFSHKVHDLLPDNVGRRRFEQLSAHMRQLHAQLNKTLAVDISSGQNPSVYHPAAYGSLRVARALTRFVEMGSESFRDLSLDNDAIALVDKLNSKLSAYTQPPGSNDPQAVYQAEYETVKFSLELEILEKRKTLKALCKKQFLDHEQAEKITNQHQRQQTAQAIRLAEQLLNECEKYRDRDDKRDLLSQTMLLAGRCLRHPTIANARALADFSSQMLPGRFGPYSTLGAICSGIALSVCFGFLTAAIIGVCLGSTGGIGLLGFAAAAYLFGGLTLASGAGMALLSWHASKREAAEAGSDLGLAIEIQLRDADAQTRQSLTMLNAITAGRWGSRPAVMDLGGERPPHVPGCTNDGNTSVQANSRETNDTQSDRINRGPLHTAHRNQFSKK